MLEAAQWLKESETIEDSLLAARQIKPSPTHPKQPVKFELEIPKEEIIKLAHPDLGPKPLEPPSTSTVIDSKKMEQATGYSTNIITQRRQQEFKTGLTFRTIN